MRDMSAVEWNTNIPNIMAHCSYDDHDAFLYITLAEASWYHRQMTNYVVIIFYLCCKFTAYPSGAPEFTPGFSGVRVTRSLVLYVCFVDRCLSLCTFSFGHCIVCSSSRYGFWLPPFGIFKVFLQYYTFTILGL
jgi:hypothetical protein